MFDATTLAAVAAELNETILHGRVQDVVQLDALTFGFEIYANHARRYLLLTAHPDDARAHLVAEKFRGTGETPSAFLSLIRKYVEGAFIDRIEQLPHERVLKIQCDHSAEGISTLVVETIGKYSNIILLDVAGVVLDAAKRVPGHLNRARVILPNHPYVPPPPQTKRDPDTLVPSALADALTQNVGTPLWQTLVRTVSGVSPVLAREIAYRVSGKTNAVCDPTQAADIARTLAQLMRNPYEPCMAFENAEPVSFAPYPLTHLPNYQTFASMSVAIETFYGALDVYAAAKETLAANLAEARDKLARKCDALAAQAARGADVERLKTSGEMILAYAYQIAPGQTRLHADMGDGVMEIPLDAHLSAVENAQQFFKAYHAAKDAAARVPQLLADARVQLEYAEQMLNDLDLAENRGEIDAVILAAREAGLVNATRRVSKQPAGLYGPRTFMSREGLTILVGKNAKQNEAVTFERARADDLWLHARNVAGAHVVIVGNGRPVPESTIDEAARLAAQYSQARTDSRVDVIVTERKHVRRVRGGKPGLVTVQQSKTVRVVL